MMDCPLMNRDGSDLYVLIRTVAIDGHKFNELTSAAFLLSVLNALDASISNTPSVESSLKISSISV